MTDAEITAAHDEKETLSVDVLIPAHVHRGSASALFTRSRQALIDRDGEHCWICGRSGAEAGHPLEAHHHPIERCFAEEIDWQLFAADAKAGRWGPHAQAFDWDNFFIKGDIYLFVDDMTANGLILCKDHHTVGDEGIHTLPGPIFLAQKYAKEGVQFTKSELIHHAT